MAQLVVTQTTDFRGGAAETNIDDLIFQTAAAAIATFDGPQIGDGLISEDLVVTGSAFADRIDIFSSGDDFVNLGGWAFQNWSANDQIRLYGTSSGEYLGGTVGRDIIAGRGGLDTLSGGGGADIFQLSTADAAFQAGSDWSGGMNVGGLDSIQTSGPAGIIDLRPVNIAEIEELAIGGGISVQATSIQIGAAQIARVSVAAGATAALQVHGSFVDLTGVVFAGWDAGDSIFIFATSTLSNNMTGSNRADAIMGLGASADFVHGGAGDDTIEGGDGADQLSGEAGNDTLSGGASFDELYGGAGNDTYVNPDGDFLFEAANEGTDTVLSDSPFDLAATANVERLFLTGILNTYGLGNALANHILGNDAANTLTGRDGDDTVSGGGGADTITGGSGLDRLSGGLQRDKIVPGTDNVRDTIVYTLIGESTGHTRDVIVGLDLNNEDRIDLPGSVAAIAAAVSGALSLATFNNNLVSALNAAALPVGNAVLFTATSGDLVNANMVYLVVDANGIAGYQANQDWVFQLETHTGTLDTTDFI